MRIMSALSNGRVLNYEVIATLLSLLVLVMLSDMTPHTLCA